MGIKKQALDSSLVSWIQNESGLGPGIGNVIYLCPTDSSTVQFKKWLMANKVPAANIFTSLTTAYAALVEGRNDVLVVMPGNYTVSAAFTWGKSYTHMIGATSPIQVNQRARFATSGNAISPMVTVSGNGCIMKNVMWSQDGTHASTAALNMYITGARNYFENVTCRNLGALSVAGTACRNLKLGSSDAENVFVRCTFGADTLDYGTGTVSCVEYETGAQNARHIFRECVFLSGGSANSTFILASGAQSINSFQLFDRCLFFNNDVSDMDAMTQAFNIGSTCGGFIILMDSLVYGAACYESTNSGVLYGRHSYAAATTDVAVALTY